MSDQPIPRVSILDKPRINIIMEPEHNRGNGFEAAVAAFCDEAKAAYQMK